MISITMHSGLAGGISENSIFEKFYIQVAVPSMHNYGKSRFFSKLVEFCKSWMALKLSNFAKPSSILLRLLSLNKMLSFSTFFRMFKDAMRI